jgi:hypothetical protein
MLIDTASSGTYYVQRSPVRRLDCAVCPKPLMGIFSALTVFTRSVPLRHRHPNLHPLAV